VSQLRCSVYITYIFTVRLRTRLQRYWRYAPSRKTQGFADEPIKIVRRHCERSEAIQKFSYQLLVISF
ncbi:MAG: hypothetical protein LBH32_08690, partial [Dysgonamonadaceae bacterium]|nr:hypothetical protein [Dysgonamonadaceae bacterium]